ncbi:MAG: hypothetical protein AB8G23_13285 [Myxococcota bacterium]
MPEPIRRVFSAGLVLALLIALGTLNSGCAQVAPEMRAKETSDGLVVAQDTRRAILWVRPDHHLGRYDNVMVNVEGFLYARGQEPLDYAQEERIEEMLEEVFSELTSSGPVNATSTPGPCTVTINLGLKDLKLHTSDHIGASTSFVSSFGSTTMVVEFRDSSTDLPLLRYMENQGLGSGPATGHMGANLSRLGNTLGEITTSMITELQTIVPATTDLQEHHCNDGIYALTGRG